MPNVVRRMTWWAQRSFFQEGAYVWFYPCEPQSYKDERKRLGSICYKAFVKAFNCKLKRGECVKVTLQSGNPYLPRIKADIREGQ